MKQKRVVSAHPIEQEGPMILKGFESQNRMSFCHAFQGLFLDKLVDGRNP